MSMTSSSYMAGHLLPDLPEVKRKQLLLLFVDYFIFTHKFGKYHFILKKGLSTPFIFFQV